ncbi:N-glycosylase [Palaeococcus pacificus DY20341]|uniref:N-glycosylase/DNA lyase n=1 Tax=Palaeococcus pacificus DY20341 TaxID=1343739 RepID=A0A075LR34_9EURY|nr:N-glycosylase/DNA lyase [Palaeococcus pacificus]AIF69185.1 N-glycosylase [Palaeococcus pacificus DY20341]
MTLDRFIKVKYSEDKERIEKLKEILSELGLECARTIEEKVDLQFSALENLHKNLNNDELFIKLVLANAIVSYQLSATGEEWWWEFSHYFSTNGDVRSIKEAYADFLPNSRTNRRLVGAKIKRLEKLEPFLKGMTLDNLRVYYDNMLKLRDDLAKALNSKREAKTIVFAVKMFGYAARIAFEEFRPYPMEIAIPEDVRINAYTKRFTNEPPASFWSKIAEEVGIPPLHIDSIIWPVLGRHNEIKERLKRYCEKAELVFKLAEL